MNNKINDVKSQIGDVSSLSEKMARKIIYHDTYEFETKMLKYVKSGDLNALNMLFQKQHVGNVGKVSNDYHKQLQNIFITTSTLVSRASIEAGLNIDEALALSDKYILKSEDTNSDEDLLLLQYQMIIDYTQRVNDLLNGHNYSRTTKVIISYLNNNINKKLDIKEIASRVGLCISQCERLFKVDTSKTISYFFIELKIKKAKQLLKDTDYPIIDISEMLGFSSQSYFCKTFKKHTNLTPYSYRFH